MDNQHEKITGYRDLSQAEIDLMNEIKAEGERVRELCDKLTALQAPHEGQGRKVDGRWVSIGRTHLQQGFMALVRSVAQPTTF
ncbi:MAG: hypothetical protein AB7Q81_24280 [Gammaproteobacteria bacterium]